ncbi:MAG: endonuclease [Lentisphaeria bacterium]|nr:phospholipase D-like domain-containing protein [Lentisphaeria bacterium]NQZ67723.1 endonuclease [Lentisphaeria bacterium]
MNHKQLKEMLEETFEDMRLSSAEKIAVRKVLESSDLNDQDLNFLRNLAFDIGRDHIRSTEGRDTLKWIENILKVSDQFRSSIEHSHNKVVFAPGTDCLKEIQALFRSSRSSIDICVFTITDNRISELIEDAHDRKLKVRIITDNDKLYDRGSDIIELSKKIPVVVDNSPEHMHHKFAIFDKEYLLNGSYNWTRTAASINYENIVVSDNKKVLKTFQAEFNRLWKILPKFK